MLRGVRGATTCAENSKEAIMEATGELWQAMMDENGFKEEELASVIFSSTHDLTAAFPAAAVREMGFSSVPLFGTLEIDKPDAVKLCVRILAHWNTDKGQNDITHVYLRGAAVLRPDIVKNK